MNEKASSQQTIIATHAVLIGLTPLLPVPLVDDLVAGYLQGRMVRLLARGHQADLSAADLEGLSQPPARSGCLGGCLSLVVTYPLKKIFQKIFFFLEIKRAVDLASYAYHYGYLADYALRAGLVKNEGSGATIAAAIDAVCRAAPIKPLESAIGATFRQSQKALMLPVTILATQLRRITGRPTPEQVAQEVEAVSDAENQAVAGLVERLQRGVASVPEEHFRHLRTQLNERIKTPGER